MAVVYLTNGSTSPYSRPGNFSDAGHLIEMIGAGGKGGTTATGTSYRSGSGGGGGGYLKLTYSSGTLSATTAFFVGIDTTSGTSTSATNATKWGQGTLAAVANTRYIQAGSFGASAGAGGAGGNATTTTVGTPPVPTYTTTTNSSGGAGGATSAVTGSAGGGGSAACPDGVGSVGGACTTASFGGGGGAAVGASNNGVAATAAEGGNGGLFGGSPAAGGTSASKQGAQGDQNNGNGGGGGYFTATSVGNSSGGLGGKRTSPWTQTSDSAQAGGGAGGGGAGACSLNTAGQTANGGNGGVYGGGGGGAGGTRSTTSTRTQGTGASGIIVITYTPAFTDSVDETVSSITDTETGTWTTPGSDTESAATSEAMSGIKFNLVRIFGGYPFLNSDGVNWAGLTLRVRFEPSMLAANNGGNERVTFEFLAGTSGSIAAAYIGHAAASGDPYDFDGGSTQLTFFGGNTSWTVSGASSISSDFVTGFSYDPTKPLLISVAFTGTQINLAGF